MERRTAPVGPPGGGRTAAAAVLASAVLLIAVAIAKPWGTGGPMMPPGPFGGSPVDTDDAAAAPAAASPETDESLVSPFCLEPSGWRVFAAERWSDRDVRSWRSAEAVELASGPTDPRIPITPVASQWILSLGYCAPISGPDRPRTGSSITVFQVADKGAERTRVLALTRLQPAASESPLGAVFAPPPLGPAGSAGPAASGRASGWQDGTYVFRIGGAIGEPFVRWLGVRVEILPAPPARVIGENPSPSQP